MSGTTACLRRTTSSKICSRTEARNGEKDSCPLVSSDRLLVALNAADICVATVTRPKGAKPAGCTAL